MPALQQVLLLLVVSLLDMLVPQAVLAQLALLAISNLLIALLAPLPLMHRMVVLLLDRLNKDPLAMQPHL